MAVTKFASMDYYNSLLEISKTKLVVVDFTASWCGPCQMIGPIFAKFADEHPNVEFAKCDVDEARDVSSACDISAMPTFHFYKGGKKVHEVIGASEEKLLDAINTFKVDKVDGQLSDSAAAAFAKAKQSEAREFELQGFFDVCMSGNVSEAKRLLEMEPGVVTRQAPPHWHAHHIRRSGRQPMGTIEQIATINPGVMNAKRTMFLIANHPATGLHLAAGNGHTELVKVLIEANAELEACDGDGDTPLAWATWSAHRETMDILVAAGANTGFVDSLTREQFEAVQGDGGSFQYLKDKREAEKQND